LGNPEFLVEKPAIFRAPSTENDWYCPSGHALGLTQEAAQNSPQWHNCLRNALPQTGFPMLQLKTDALMATPCDDEEDNMAMLCCHGRNGEMFMLTRYPDEDDVELTWDYEPSTLDGLKVTLSDTTLRLELAAGDADALGGKDQLEITHATAAADMAEVEQTLQNILKGTGTYIRA
jgi:hypothetical protein